MVCFSRDDVTDHVRPQLRLCCQKRNQLRTLNLEMFQSGTSETSFSLVVYRFSVHE